MNSFSKIVLLLTLVFVVADVNAQLKDFGIKTGLQFNSVMPATEFEDENGYSLSSFIARGFLRFELTDFLSTELGAGYGNLRGDEFNFITGKKGPGEYSTTIIPFDARLLITPLNLENWNPYIYGGMGVANYNVGTKPAMSNVSKDKGWTVIFPFGVGSEIKLGEGVLLDLNAGATNTFTENLNAFKIGDQNDAYFNLSAGVVFTGESMSSDKDNDGLTKREEKEIATDPNNPDTDSDGLKDGEEVKKYSTDPKIDDTDGDGLKDGEEISNYKTDPTKIDSDNDGLNDYDEVITHKTNPLAADTDSDGLKDGEEVLKYKTSPFKNDTDDDGLKDSEEILKYKTDPLKGDTDGDELNDGEEVSKYKTDPLKEDTDGGTVNDGVEVKRGTNPLNAEDDVVKIGVPVVLEGITFEFNKFDITPESEQILMGALKTLQTYPDIVVEISGHTDNVGGDTYNQKLSQKRADAVKFWLVAKGISSEKITSIGYGEDNPRVANDTPENRRLNRRIEFKRIK